MERQRLFATTSNAHPALMCVVAAMVQAAALLISGCAAASHPEPKFEPTLLVISPDSASGPDFLAPEVIEGPDDIDYFELTLHQAFNTVDVMTTGDTNTAGQIETIDRMPITAPCEGERHKATPPCVWGTDPDIDTPNSERSEKFNTMEASKNFIWEGSLDAGTYYIRVTGQNDANDATGPYVLTVELTNEPCPSSENDPHGYYCDD